MAENPLSLLLVRKVEMLLDSTSHWTGAPSSPGVRELIFPQFT